MLFLTHVRIIACIEEQRLIHKILAHMNQQQKSRASIKASSGIRASPTKVVSQMTL